MNDGISIIFFIFFTILGGLFGYDVGKSNENKTVSECEKALPRNVQCKIIAVPIN